MATFHIASDDGERLFAWLVTPLGVYSRHAEQFIEEDPLPDDIEHRVAFRLLKRNPEARLVIYFHGNTATVAQGRRTEEYRMYSSGASDKIFVLAFDYRGFGKSTGSPSEQGLLNDAKAVVHWAIHTAGISPERIVFLGHSLGTAVATAITHHYANLDAPIGFAGLILCASFTNTGSAFASYAIADVIPVSIFTPYLHRIWALIKVNREGACSCEAHPAPSDLVQTSIQGYLANRPETCVAR